MLLKRREAPQGFQEIARSPPPGGATSSPGKECG